MQKKMSNIDETQEIIVLDHIPDKIYSTNLSSNKIENFIKLLTPTTPLQILRSFDSSSQNYKLQYPHVYSNSTFYSMTYNSYSYWSNKNQIPIVIDSGASKSINPISSDFIGQISPMDAPIQGLSSTTKIKGIGSVKWSICDSRGTSTSIETVAYFIPEADIRIFSPQACFNDNKSGSIVMDKSGTTLTLSNQLSLYFKYHKGNNLPMATIVPSNMVATVCII